MNESVANRRSLLGLLRGAGGFAAGRFPLTILEPPLRSRRRVMLSVKLVGLLMAMLQSE